MMEKPQWGFHGQCADFEPPLPGRAPCKGMICIPWRKAALGARESAMSSDGADKCSSHPSSKKPLYGKQKPCQKTTTAHKAEINRVSGPKPQRIHLQHSFCIALGSTVEGAESKGQRTRMSAVK
ncbi:uncharacterized protein LOC143443509 [Arvicanthis niloticus]|uniref:uncharacterized protein LOC143443509 n=1 Tax=Arvicanthis niloticus TaxID=61156 RepID=UPI00403CDAC5